MSPPLIVEKSHIDILIGKLAEILKTREPDMQIIQNAIAGKLTQSLSTRTQPVFNPATGEAIATLPLSTLDEVNAAVAAAKKAQPAWGNTTPMKRARVMF
eukprot:gene52487-70186_t